MATYIRNDSLDNFNAAMQNLAAISQRARALNLEEEQMYNRQGVNTSGWQAKGAFSNLNRPDIPLKERQQEQYNVNADQGGILAQVKQENPDMYKYMTRQEQMPSGLSGVYAAKTQNIDPFKQSDTANKFASQISSYKELDKANTPIRKANAAIDSYNAKAEAANRNKPKFRSVYEGDEYDQQNQLLEDAYNAINSSTNINDKIRAYNTYYTAGKNISAHYQHRFEPESPAFFGISAGGNQAKSSAGKLEDMYIHNGDGDSIMPLKLSASDINNPNIRKELYEKHKESLQSAGITRWQDMKLGYGSGNSYNPSIKDRATIDLLKQQSAEKDQNALKMLDKGGGWDIGSGETLIENEEQADTWLKSRGYTINKDANGKHYVTKNGQETITVSPQSKEEQKQSQSFKSLYIKKR